MSIPQSQLALQRVLAYLHLAGLEITPEVEHRALLLVSTALESASDDLLTEAMRRVPDAFVLPRQDTLQQAPEIHRGSLHYGAY